MAIDPKEQPQQKQNVEIDLNEKIAPGRYANLAIISHSPTEFVFDFAAFLPGMQKPRVNNRVLMTPEHAKRLYLSLKENIEKYERNIRHIEVAHTAPQKGQGPDQVNSQMVGEA